MAREESKRTNARMQVSKSRTGADELVVVKKRRNGRGAKGLT